MSEFKIPDIDLDNIDLEIPQKPVIKLADIPDQDNLNDYLRNEAENASVLKDLIKAIEQKKIENVIDETVPLPDSSLTIDQAALLFYLAHAPQPTLTLEIGFQYGLSSAFIITAHTLNNKNAGHAPIEHNALEKKSGIAAALLKHFGLENYQIMEHEPWAVLPQLLIQDIASDLELAFLNTSESFSDTLVNFYYIDKTLLDNGFIVFNTVRNDRYNEAIKTIEKHYEGYEKRVFENGLIVLQKTGG